MATIVDHQIKKWALERDLIVPFNDDQLNPASYDVRLGSEILVEGMAIGPESERKRWIKEDISKQDYWLLPGEFVLAVTEEVVSIPAGMESIFQLKSSRGREGYEHALAGYIDPGFKGRITLELANLNRNHKLLLKKGMLIGQLRFCLLADIPDKTYESTGHYYGDMGVQPSRVTVFGSENVID